MDLTSQWGNDLTLFVNGKRFVISNPDPRTTLLNFLRTELNYKGTKLGCGEGGCGACTVMISFHKNGGTSPESIEHFSCNACLAPLCSLDGFAITTIEGIGGMKQGLHPVQRRIASMHGSQCGFCTPGIVMSLYAQLRSHPNSTPDEIAESLDGNLCRCTGYRPILDAAKSLSNAKGGGGCCQGKGSDCPCAAERSDSEDTIHCSTEKSIQSLDGLESLMTSSNSTEPIFPPALLKYEAKDVFFSKSGFKWFQPVTLDNLLTLKSSFPDARLVAGNTEVGIEVKFKALEYNTFINPTHIQELKELHVEIHENIRGLRVGSCVSINGLRNYIEHLEHNCTSDDISIGGEAKVHAYELRGLVAIRHMLSWFASNQIRNVASIAGNIVTASPISDLNPMLLSCGAILTIASLEGGTRDCDIKDFFLAYRKVDLKPSEILKSIFIPFTSRLEFVVPLKQARRREDDISIVTAGVRIKLHVDPIDKDWKILDFAAAFGGMAPKTILATSTMDNLINKPWNKATFEEACRNIRSELSLPESVPGGQAEYRMALATSFFFRSFLTVTNELQALVESSSDSEFPDVLHIDPLDKSAAENFITLPKPISRGEQQYSIRKGELHSARPVPHAIASDEDAVRSPVGDSLMHKSANVQVSGEAVYTDDIKLNADALHGALVTSTRVHAKLISVDTSDAELCDGFVKYFCAKDVTGSNHIGAVIKDEEVFATDFVKHYGAVIGIVVAKTHEQALYAARKINIVYEDLPAIVSIQDAIDANSFFPGEHQITSGDIRLEELSSDVIVEGTIRLGGQDHFYLETNCTVAIPGENGSLEVFSSTQNPTKTQNFCASVIGSPASHVVARCKRMGGAFGGKETRSVFIACTAALAAHLLGQTVSINIERDLDMSITGQRHAFVINYRAGCTKDGDLKFLDAKLYNNAGYSLDLSHAIMDRALFHSDSVYKWPAIFVRGQICRTNQPSHTAFRGFGGPQGLYVSESVITHLAHASGKHVDILREKNFYQDGDKTHFGQTLVEFFIPRIWKEIYALACINERRLEIDRFNLENRWKKRGLAVLPTKFGINFTAKFMNQGGALVHVYQDGTVLIAHGGTEMGQGLNTKMIQVAAQVFGISDTLIHAAETATNTVANASPTAASMSTDLYGMAVLDACQQILERLKPIRVNNNNISTSWQSLIQSAFFARIDLSAHGYYAIDTDRCGYDWDKVCVDNAERGLPFNYFTQGVAASEVEVDCLTGDCKVLRTDILMDLGKSINPAIDIGQIEGAFMQGFGWSTMEELVWGDKDHKWVRPGQLFTRGPGTYKIPAFNDVPIDFRVHLADTNNSFAVHSSKAVGEPPFFLGCCPFFAIKDIIHAARADAGLNSYYHLNHPATSERIRMSFVDPFSSICTGNNSEFHPKGSW